MRWVRPLGVAIASAVLASSVAAVGLASTAAAATPNDLLVTYVARACNSYTDVMANLARNNFMESLEDLGPNTAYTPDSIVNPAAEAAGTPNCQPLVGWRFAMGTGSVEKTPATLNLSVVSGAFPTNIVTTPSTPELDPTGNATGRTLTGAVTVALSPAEAEVVARGSPLFVQGGTPAAPLNNQQATYGYAALRCATDGYNGDNVEKLYFPPSERHVFCYYYAVTPAPEPGTIVVNKQVSGGTNGSGTFRFNGSISYGDSNGDGVRDFSLTASAAQSDSETFIRGAVAAGGAPWTFAEQPLPGWLPPTQPNCVSSNGTSVVTYNSVTRQVAVQLAGQDTVTCTYTNSRNVTGPFSIAKETVGGVGSFPFLVEVPPPGPNPQATITTTEEQTPVTVASGSQAPPGTYIINENLPADSPVGSWDADSVFCDGTSLPIEDSGQVRTAILQVVTGQSVDCLVTNRFTPGGSIEIHKTTLGGIGSFGYTVHPIFADPRTDPGASYHATATTTQPGTPVTADWQGPPASELVAEPPRSYIIEEQTPPISSAGSWRLVSVDCGPNVTARSQGAAADVTVTLDPAHPDASCDFTNQFDPAGTLTVTKHTSADTALRPNPAALTLTCSDGTTATLSVVPGDATATAGPAPFPSASTCRITELHTGAAPGVSVSTDGTFTVNGGPPQPFELGTTIVPVGPGNAVDVTVNNTLTAPPVTTSGGGSASLPATGADAPSPGLALLLLAGGVLLVALSRRGRSGSGHAPSGRRVR